MKVAIEIRPGEGGEDAKLLAVKQASIYEAYATKNGIKATLKNQSLA